MSRRDLLDAVVIGGGVVGSAAALLAAQQGLRVAWVEARAPAPWRADTPDLRVYALASDNQALLARLGVWPAIAAARVQPYRRMRVWDAAGGGELDFDADALGRGELGHIVENDLLVDRLGAALAAAPGVQRYCPDAVEAISEDSDCVRLTLRGGARLRARLLLAADGADSSTRERLGIEVDRHDYGQRGLVAYVRCELPHEETAWQRFLPGGPLAFLPFTEGQCSIVWTLADQEAERLLALESPAFCAELTRAFDARLGAVIEVGPRRAFPLRRQLARCYHQGRALLLGDAAHAVHPLAGQGVNLGLRDVAALGEMLSSAIRRNLDIGAEHRLARWARDRRSETALAAYAFEGINRVFSNEAMLTTLVRGHLLGAAGRLPPVSQALWAWASGRA